MLNFDEYKHTMRKGIDFDYVKSNYPKTYKYWLFLENSLLRSIEKTSSEHFWEVVKKLLAVDSKFILLTDLIKYDFSDTDIIELVKKDYYSLNKELCGYKLNQIPHNSIIFLELFCKTETSEIERVIQ